MKKKLFIAQKAAAMLGAAVIMLSANTVDVEAHDSTDFTQVPGTVIYYGENVASDDLEDVIAGYVSLPDNFKVKIVSDCEGIYLIDLSEESLADTYYADSGNFLDRVIGGLYYGASRLVYSDGSVKKQTKSYIDMQGGINSNLEITLYHELGHLVADYGGSASKNSSATDTMGVLYATYAPVVATYDNHASANCYSKSELFAESFRIYIQNPAWLMQYCPELYTYIDQCMMNYAGPALPQVSTPAT